MLGLFDEGYPRQEALIARAEGATPGPAERRVAMEPSPQPRPVRIGVFEVDFATRELRKHGIKIKLHGQPSKVLSILLEHSGQVVTRESYPEDSGRAIPSSISNTAWRSARYGRPRATPPTVRATLRLFPDADIALSQKPPWSVEVRSTSWHLLPVIRPRQKTMIRLRL